jgi:hypothetical protein
MTDSQRLDFLDQILKSGLPIGIKPNYRTLVGTVYIKEGATNIRQVIDTIKEINDAPETAEKTTETTNG